MFRAFIGLFQGYLKLLFIRYHLVHAVFVDHLCAPANWFVEVALLYKSRIC
jgi:hypothetical protein